MTLSVRRPRSGCRPPSRLDVAFDVRAGRHDRLRRIGIRQNHAAALPWPGSRSPMKDALPSAIASLFDSGSQINVRAAERRIGLRVSAPRALSAPHGGREHRLRAVGAATGAERQRAHRGDCRVVSHRAPARPAPRRNLRRRASARRAGASARHQSGSPAARRAAVGARPRARSRASSTTCERWNDAHGIPILYVTHSQREVFALGERVVVLAERIGGRRRHAARGDGRAGRTSTWRSWRASKICSTRWSRPSAPRPGTMVCSLASTTVRPRDAACGRRGRPAGAHRDSRRRHPARHRTAARPERAQRPPRHHPSSCAVNGHGHAVGRRCRRAARSAPDAAVAATSWACVPDRTSGW